MIPEGAAGEEQVCRGRDRAELAEGAGGIGTGDDAAASPGDEFGGGQAVGDDELVDGATRRAISRRTGVAPGIAGDGGPVVAKAEEPFAAAEQEGVGGTEASGYRGRNAG
jgi:hypothetical protein